MYKATKNINEAGRLPGKIPTQNYKYGITISRLTIHIYTTYV